MANLLRIPISTATDARVISTSDILTITYTSTSAVRIVYKVTNIPSVTPGTATLGAVVLRCSFNTADASYVTHDAFVAAIIASISSSANPSPIFICPELPGARTIATVYEAPITLTA
jgi:hypothetical protein